MAGDVEVCTSEGCTRLAVRFIGEHGVPFCEPCYVQEVLPEWAATADRERQAERIARLRAERDALRERVERLEAEAALYQEALLEVAYVPRDFPGEVATLNRMIEVARAALAPSAPPSAPQPEDENV